MIARTNVRSIATVDRDRSPLAPFLLYVVAFHLVWAAWPLVLYPRLLALGPATLSYAVVNLSIRLAVWVLPVMLYLRYVDGVEPIGYLKLNQNIRRGIFIGVALTVMNLTGSIARFGPPHPTWQSVTWNSVLGTSMLVGVIEEIPYRGFMLQKFTERVGFWLANLITSVLFLAVHLPGWTSLHMLSPERAASVFIFGAVMTAANWSVDWSWWAADPRERDLSDRIQAFFESKGLGTYGNRWTLDGTTQLEANHSTALVATNAVASLAATNPRAARFVDALWNAPIPSGQYRYYDGMWYLMGLMHCSGEYRIWTPSWAPKR